MGSSHVTTAELNVAREAVRVGAEIVLRSFHDDGVETRRKGDEGLVTDADTESERAIARVIHDAFPEHLILGEELHDADPTNAEHVWLVDPLDGTNNFAHGIPHFAVSIAYYRAGRPECGVICNPVRDDWYVAARGQGAWHNDLRAAVADTTDLRESLVGLGFYYDRGAMMEATLAAMGDLFRHGVHGIRRFGTASLDLCQVGVGMFGAFFEYHLAPWDFGAGRLFVEEAGGRVTTCGGEPVPLAATTMLATNGLIHDSVLEIVQRHEADATAELGI